MAEAYCVICHQTEQWHKEHRPKHRFTTEPGSRLEEDRTNGDTPAPSPGLGGDPILRLALVHAGVITEADITQATEWINAAREAKQAVLLLPDANGKMEYHLMSFQEAMVAKAGR